ncbi:hypothetical protein M885DRAFT_592822 [Pelagophyceae sp. CCMP2097]|nr:hypothetical protein M885DRAFT_592822 [Pelagophyceae sp. CCMP2097]
MRVVSLLTHVLVCCAAPRLGRRIGALRANGGSLSPAAPAPDGARLSAFSAPAALVPAAAGAVVPVASESAADGGVIRAFFGGAKRLWADMASWRRLRVEGRVRRLDWREERIVRESHWHLLRMLPLLVNPLPPPFGLVLIAAASTAPRWLLTPEFWTIAQCEQFARLEAGRARQRHAKLLAECAATTAVAAPAMADPSLLRRAAAETALAPAGAAAFAALLAAIVAAFDDDAPLALDVLQRRHLVRLARTIRPRPVSRFALRFAGRRRLRHLLALAADRSTADDDSLAAFLGKQRDAGAGDALSTRELLDVCAQRGLRVDGDDAQRAARLAAWFDARAILVAACKDRPLPPSRAAASERTPPRLPRAAPASATARARRTHGGDRLVLHMPAIFSALLERATGAPED